MALRMARPIRDKTGTYLLKERVPADLLNQVRGKVLTLPIGNQWHSVKAGEYVQLSLRTRDNDEGALRHATADASLRRQWKALRDGPKPLRHEQAVALAGEIYRAMVSEQREAATPKTVREMHKEAAALREAAKSQSTLATLLSEHLDADGSLHLLALVVSQEEWDAIAPGRDWHTVLDEIFGNRVDALLAREGLLVDEDSRCLIYDAVREAARDAFKVSSRELAGDYAPDPKANRFPPIETVRSGRGKVSISKLFADYIKELKANGSGTATEKRFKSIIAAFKKHIDHDDAARVTLQDVVGYKDARLAEGISPTTLRKADLAAIKRLFGWAVENGRLKENPATGAKVIAKKRPRGREKGFTEDEAIIILRASLEYVKPEKELQTTANAKRWTPWLCAFIGARITEMSQLTKENVRKEGNINYIRITPDDGSVKSGHYRDVPLHPQLIELGFLKFVEKALAGPLFYQPRKGREPDAGRASLAGVRVGRWIRSLGVDDERVAPNHGWRHRFKSLAIVSDIKERIWDAIQDHAPRTAGEGYGDVKLQAKVKAINSLPRYKLV